jgi:hypothetical protein
VGGPIVFIHSATDDQGRADGYFYAVVVLAAHRVQSIGDVWLGDTLATDAKYNGLVRIDRHLGAADQVANANLTAETAGKWPANHRGRGRAYVAVRLKITAQAFPSGPPNIADRGSSAFVPAPAKPLLHRRLTSEAEGRLFFLSSGDRGANRAALRPSATTEPPDGI